MASAVVSSWFTPNCPCVPSDSSSMPAYLRSKYMWKLISAGWSLNETCLSSATAFSAPSTFPHGATVDQRKSMWSGVPCVNRAACSRSSGRVGSGSIRGPATSILPQAPRLHFGDRTQSVPEAQCRFWQELWEGATLKKYTEAGSAAEFLFVYDWIHMFCLKGEQRAANAGRHECFCSDSSWSGSQNPFHHSEPQCCQLPVK